ncbi:MAG: hypothetical protein WC511_02520 [Candidatus Pacearchaeota archaeon]
MNKISKLNIAAKNVTLATFIVNELNKLLSIDSQAIQRLFAYHVSCNSGIIHHPTVTVNEKDRLGVLGLLNGFVGKDALSEGLIVAITDSSGKIVKFKVSKN